MPIKHLASSTWGSLNKENCFTLFTVSASMIFIHLKRQIYGNRGKKKQDVTESSTQKLLTSDR